MSFSQMQTMVAHSEQAPVQAQLECLVQELKWSYVALWSLNPQTRSLGWKGGHWRQSDPHGWNHEQYFNSTFKSCQFSAGYGSVGIAFARGGNIWMPGSSALDKAGSKQQAEFLQRARISTTIFIPWSDGVLELGTCDNVPENLGLMDRIRTYFMTNIVPTLGQQASGHSRPFSQAPSSFPQSSRPEMQPGSFASLSPLRHHLSDSVDTQSFEPNSLNQQIMRRPAGMSDMFLGDAGGKEVMNTDTLLVSAVDARSSWGLPTLTTRAGAMQSQQAPLPAGNEGYYPEYPPVQQRTRGQYRSRSGTTSSSVSSLEEAASTRLSGDSPEQNVLFMASSQGQPSHSTTSSSPRRGTSSRSPEMNQLEDTIRTQSLQETHENHVEDDIQLDPFSLMLEGEPLETGTYSFPSLETSSMSQINLLDSTNGNNNHYHNHNNGNNNHYHNHNNGNNAYNGTYELPQPARHTFPSLQKPQGPFKSWRHTRILAPALQKKTDRQNQELLRRCIEMMKKIPQTNDNLQGVQNNEMQAVMHNVGQQGPRVASSSSPETVTDGFAHDPFDQVPLRAQRRPRGGSRIASMGVVHHGHDEAAMNHMMAERRRREKQKENFAALRRLVPIISKADKASILGDAIVYLKDLQKQIEGLEASKAESERKHETLQMSYSELEQRNKELELMVRPPRLHSM